TGEHDVHAEVAVDNLSLIHDRQQDLALVVNAAQVQLSTQTSLVHRLQQPRPENPMDLDRRPDDRFRQLLILDHVFPSPIGFPPCPPCLRGGISYSSALNSTAAL